MTKALTAKAVEAAQPASARREVPDGAFPGMYLVVQPSGAKSWAYRYRHGDKPRKLTLGKFPALPLAEAREEARKAARAIGLGQDPSAAKADARADAKVARETERDKISTLVDAYHKRHLAHLRTGAEARRYLDKSAVASWGERDVGTISKRDVVELLDGIVDSGSPIAANRTLAYLRAFFGWLKARGVLDGCPTDGVKPPAPERSRDRVLSDDEVALLWRACGSLGQPFGPLYRFLLLTGQRLREAAEMTDRELDGDLWTIGAARAKNGEAHVVPLSGPALDVLASVGRIGRKGLIFTTTGDAPVSGFAKGKQRLDKAIAKLSDDPIPPFVIHDLRRTAASGMARLGIAPHVLEAVLNHRSGAVSGIAKVYNRHDYAAEKRAALEAWGRYALDVVGERSADNVVQIGAR